VSKIIIKNFESNFNFLLLVILSEYFTHGAK
jgi:hypothetical protein